MDSISVTVNILERSYKLMIAPQDETRLRNAAAYIDAQARMFKKQFSHRDNQDLLAMVALMQVTELTKTKDSLQYKDSQLIEKLTEIDAVLEKNLHRSEDK
ncbi:MAG: cell division protein ZapA [Bacteroidales bacterium]|nr:cell division protein ZapA [Bacteroidales bacterium]